ncbi:cytochrome B [Pseudomonas sp. WN033]|nr:cytochrome B [Pseudomonas sp. WN033]
MAFRNTHTRYGLVTVLLHWGVAVTVIGLAILGLWMTDLSYYSPYYRSAPFWHKSTGIALAAVLVLRLLWRWINPKPAHLPNHARWEVRLASAVHGLLYMLLFLIVISGYLISTARGQGISVFGWFELPALVSGLPRQEDRAGDLHFWSAMLLLGLVALHALGALKHHFIDRDDTLRRMLGLRPRASLENSTKEN